MVDLIRNHVNKLTNMKWMIEIVHPNNFNSNVLKIGEPVFVGFSVNSY